MVEHMALQVHLLLKVLEWKMLVTYCEDLLPCIVDSVGLDGPIQ